MANKSTGASQLCSIMRKQHEMLGECKKSARVVRILGARKRGVPEQLLEICEHSEHNMDNMDTIYH